MKILNIHIENFGVLHGDNINLNDGLNEKIQKNGWGKSTLASFIKVMFFGFDGEGKRSGSERVKFSPWQGGVYGGSIVFSIGDREYKLYRTFGQKASEDKFLLQDNKTQLICEDYSKNIGEEIFGIDRESFGRTFYLSQNDCECHVTDQIRAKLGGLSLATDDISKYDKADKAFDDILNKNSFSRKTGEGKKLELSIEEAKTQKALLDNCDELLSNSINKNRELKAKKNELLEEQKKLTVLAEKVNIYSLSDEEEKRLNDYRLRGVNEYQKSVIDDNILEWEALDKKYREEIILKQELLDEMSGVKEALADNFSQNNNLKKHKTIFILSLIMGLVTILAYVVISIIMHKNLSGLDTGVLGYVFLGFFAVFFVMAAVSGIFLFKLKEKMKLENIVHMKELKDKEKEIKSKLEACDSEILEITAGRENIKQYVSGLSGEVSFEEISGKMYQLLSQMKDCDELTLKEQKYNEIRRELKALNENSNVSSGLDALNTEIDNCEEEIRELEKKVSKRDELSGFISQMSKKKAKLNEYVRLITITKKLLGEAKDKYTEKYKNPVFSNFEHIIESIKIDGDFSMNSQMEINIMEQGLPRDISSMSAGLKDLYGFIMRLSFTEAMFSGEKPPIILDDPFTNLDDDLKGACKNVVRELAKKYQVIYLTCSNDRQIGEN